MIWWFGAFYYEMRITVKVLGVFSALFGVFLLSVFPFALGNAIKTSDNGAVLASCILPLLGLGFIFSGRHLFRVNLESQDRVPPISNLARFLVSHRRDLKVLAQIGCVLSLLRLVAACFSSDWPARQTTGFLLIGALGLGYCGGKASNPAVTDNPDWTRVPTYIRRVLEPAWNALGVLWFGSVFLFIYTQSHPSGSEVSHYVSRILIDAMITFVYGLAVLFFGYGELQPPISGTIVPSDEAEPL